MAIIGCGPAGTSIIVRAIHLGMLSELCQGNLDDNNINTANNNNSSNNNTAGICMFDKDPPSRIGGGRLQDYVVCFFIFNLSISAAKFAIR
jgi:hypothetical protein